MNFNLCSKCRPKQRAELFTPRSDRICTLTLLRSSMARKPAKRDANATTGGVQPKEPVAPLTLGDTLVDTEMTDGHEQEAVITNGTATTGESDEISV